LPCHGYSKQTGHARLALDTTPGPATGTPGTCSPLAPCRRGLGRPRPCARPAPLDLTACRKGSVRARGRRRQITTTASTSSVVQTPPSANLKITGCSRPRARLRRPELSGPARSRPSSTYSRAVRRRTPPPCDEPLGANSSPLRPDGAERLPTRRLFEGDSIACHTPCRRHRRVVTRPQPVDLVRDHTNGMRSLSSIRSSTRGGAWTLPTADPTKPQPNDSGARPRALDLGHEVGWPRVDQVDLDVHRSGRYTPSRIVTALAFEIVA